MFNAHQGECFDIKRKMKNSGVKLTKYNSFDYLTRYFGHVLGTEGLNKIEKLILYMELSHYFHQHNVFHITTPVARALLRSEIKVPPKDLVFPFPMFEICFESDFTLSDGSRVPAALCGWNWPIEFQQNVVLRMASTVGAKMPTPMQGPTTIDVDPYLFLCAAAMVSLVTAQTSPGMSFFKIPFSLDENKNVEQVIDDLKPLTDDTLKVKQIPEARRTDEWRLIHSKVALGLMCYYNVKDADIEAYRDPNRAHISSVTPRSFIVGKHWDRTSPEWHLRKEHIRWLRNERFKRDEDGRIRCVWVRATEVNKHKKPENPVIEQDPSIILVKDKEEPSR